MRCFSLSSAYSQALILPLSLAIGIIGCGATPGPKATSAAPATLVSIKVSPTAPSIKVGATAQFTATGSYADKSKKDITDQVFWLSSDVGVATIGSTGIVAAFSEGTSTVTAKSGAIKGSTTLTVTAEKSTKAST